MHNPQHRRPLQQGAGRRNDRSLICYGIVVSTASLLLLAVLATTVSILKACALAGTVLVLFSAAGWVSRRCSAADGAGAAPAALPTTATVATTMPVTTRPGAACGLVNAAIDALPAFAYACQQPEGSSSKSGRCALCSVCLEDVEAGEMVRQLPACGHLFHVGCIDMWLQTHATCPLCRCNVSPQPVGVEVVTAAAEPPDGALPPA